MVDDRSIASSLLPWGNRGASTASRDLPAVIVPPVASRSPSQLSVHIGSIFEVRLMPPQQVWRQLDLGNAATAADKGGQPGTV
jgi:hypothetical protein